MSVNILSLSSQNFVEARMTAITIKEEISGLEISFRGQDATKFTLVAEGVDRLYVDELREQNIVDQIHIWDSTSVPHEYHSSLVELVSGSSEINIPLDLQSLVDREVLAIQKGDKVFFETEAIYGATVSLLARKITVHPQ